MARLVVAVTGGIASGKSLVDRAFATLGVPVVDADLIAREIVAPGQPALREIAETFGPSVLCMDGSLDRPALRALIFSDAVKRRRLEAITHPRIRALMRNRCDAAVSSYVIASIPLLAESGTRAAYPWLDRVLVVDAPVSQQRARLISRDGINQQLAENIIGSQVSRAVRLKIASDVLINDSGIFWIPQAVAKLDAVFRALAAR
jgi:dephospho-CoA kinase